MGISAGAGAAIAAGVGAAGSIGSGLLNDKKGSGGSTSSQSQVNTGPYAPQVPFDISGLDQAKQIEKTRLDAGPYQGELTAPQNDMQAGAAENAYGYATGAGANLPYQTANAAGGLLNYAPAYGSNAAGIAANGIGGPNSGLMGALQGYGTGAQTTQGPSAGLSTALNGAAINGANSLAGYNSGLQRAGAQGLSDPTQRIANDAATYANNPGVQASINATNANINNVLNEQTVPQLNRQAAMGGSLNSSRAGMAEAMANHDAALAQGSADASILNNAYNTGMSTASGLYSNGLNSSINANSAGITGANNTANNVGNMQQNLGEFNTTAQLGAANSGLTQGLQYGLGNANTQLAANAQLGQGLNTGIAGANASGNQAQNAFNLASGAGALQQQGQQAADTNAYQQWQLQNQYQQNVLNDYWKIAATPLGTNGTTTAGQQNTLPPQDPISNALGGAAAGAGLYNKFFPNSNTTNGLYNFGAAGSMPNGMSNTGGALSAGFDGNLYNSGGIF